jgi:hypothetical protein
VDLHPAERSGERLVQDLLVAVLPGKYGATGEHFGMAA